jgi:hypothetical protein
VRLLLLPASRGSPRRAANESHRSNRTARIAPLLQMDFSFIIPGYTSVTFTQTQSAAVCAVLKAKAGGEW